MVDVRAPVVDPGRDGFFPKQTIQRTGIFDGFIFPGPLPDANNDLAAAVLLQVPGIRQAGQVTDGLVEINLRQFGGRQLEVGTIQTVESAQGNGALKHIRML